MDHSVQCPTCHAPCDATLSDGVCTRCALAFALDTGPALAPLSPEVIETHTPAPEGQAFGEYVLLDEIGRGGVGIVYRAWQRRLRRTVALKMLSPARLDTLDARGRFRREAELTAGLDHPNILPLYEVGEQDGRPYYTAKLAQGGNLADRIDAYRGRSLDAARLVATLARALAHAHARGVLHRDLKPSNIVFDADARCMVADFGLARRLEIDSSLTGLDAVIGTPRYVAPEVIATPGAKLTGAVDVYGLGAILYELLTGQPPFAELAPVQLLRLIATRHPVPPRRIDPAIPARLETICLRCLEKRPADRFASAAVLADALDSWLRDAAAHPHARTAWLRGLLPSRRRAWAWRAAAVLALGTAGTLWAMAQHGMFSGTPDPASAIRRVVVLPAHVSPTPGTERAAVDALVTALRNAHITAVGDYESGPPRGRMRARPPRALALGIQSGAFVQVKVSAADAAPGAALDITAIDALRGERIWQGQAQPAKFENVAHQLAAVLAARRHDPAPEAGLPRPALAALARGTELYDRLDSRANDAAIEAFQQALAIAPAFALAHARLSIAYSQRSNRFGGAAFWNDSAIEEAERAVRLDPQLAAGYGALGFAYYNKGWWQRSTAAYERAQSLGLIGVESSLALNYYGTGRFEEALSLYRATLRIAPNSGMTRYLAAQTLFTLGATDAGEREMRAAMAQEPNAGKRTLMESEIAKYRHDYAKCRTLAGGLDPDLVSGGFGSAGDIGRACAERQRDWPTALALLQHEKQRYTAGTGDLGNAGPALEEAVLLTQSGRQAQAKPVLAAAHRSAQAGIDGGREYPKIWLRMATVLRLEGDLDGAYRTLDAAFAHGLTINARNEDDFEFLPFQGDPRFVALRNASRSKVATMRARVEASLAATGPGAASTASID